jgi:hypothetical protein
MNRQHYTEIEIEKLTSDTTEGKSQDISNTDEHLKTCLSCKQKYEFFQKFYTNLKDELNKPVDDRVTELINSLSSSNIIYLKPYSAQPDFSKLGVGVNSYVLAAQSMNEEIVRYKSTATFAAEHENTLVKIIDDKTEKIYQLFVLSENDKHRNNVLVGIAEPDKDKLLFPTNNNGIVHFPYSSPIDWKNTTLILMTPSEIVSFEDLEKRSGEMLKGIIKFDLKKVDENLVLSFTQGSRVIPHHILAVHEDKSHICKRVENQTVTIPTNSDNKIVEISFFT